MSLKTTLLVLLFAGAVTACAPDSYIDSPAARTVVAQVLPKIPGVSEAAACHTAIEDGFVVTVLFDNQDRAHYEISDGVITHLWTVSGEKEKSQSYDDRNFGCFNSGRFQILPDYWLTVGDGVLTHAYIDEQVVHNRAFHPDEERKLKQFATVIKVAIADHAKFIPTEQSWK